MKTASINAMPTGKTPSFASNQSNTSNAQAFLP